MDIPKGRCCCCGLQTTGEIAGYELCKLHYRLTMKDILTAIAYFKNVHQFQIKEHLEKGEWQYE